MGMGDGAKMRFQIPSRIRQDDVTQQCCDATMSSINQTCRIPDQAATRVIYSDNASTASTTVATAAADCIFIY
eukprot:scaffold163128_cov37-Attheya_sp.AAC.1